jgi:hypothetical protein
VGLDNPKLSTVLSEAEAGALQLPDFQREWKWDDERIRALLATVTLGHPLGVVMTLKTGGTPQFKARPLAGVEECDGQVPARLLLDGQQRITSLFQSFRRDRPVETEDSRKVAVRRWYYIDIEAAVRRGVDREDAILSVPEDRLLRRDRWRRELDLRDEAREWAAGCFPLNLAFDTLGTFQWMQKYLEAFGETGTNLWPQFADLVLKNITAFSVPMIELEPDTPKDAVCSVFERVNTGGVPLDVFELLTATYAGNLAYSREHDGNDFNLGVTWRSIKQRLTQVYPVLGTQGGREETGLTSSDFLQAVCLVRSYEGKREGAMAAVSCKRRDLLNLPLTDFVRLAPVVEAAFARVGEFLSRQFVFRDGDVPYRTQLVPLAAVLTLLWERDDVTESAEEVITRWYWCGVFGELYGSAVESRMARDVEQLMAAIDRQDDCPEPDTIAEAAFPEWRLDRLTTRNSAAYKGLFALIGRQGAYDWYFTEAPISQEILIGQSVEIRHIFPKEWLSRYHGKDGRANSIVNKTLLSYRAGSHVVGAPSGYLPVLAREAGIHDAWMDDRVHSHLIDPKLLRADDFEGCYEDRRRRLLALIEAATGKPVVRSGESPEER